MLVGTTITTMSMSDGDDIAPPPLAGGGWEEGASSNGPPPPPPNPLPQGEGEKLLRLLAWLSPGFPTGGYAYSHGLEWAVDCGDITDGDTLRIWLTDVLIHGSGRNDAILLRHACRPGADQGALNDLAIAVAPSRERRAETLDQGTAFAAAAAPWYPPALAGACRLSDRGRCARRSAWAGRRHDHSRLPSGLRRQPDLRRRPPGPARPKHGLARSRRAGADHPARCGGIARCNARRPGRLRLSFRSRRHAA